MEESDQVYIAEIRAKRTSVLLGIWEHLVKSGKVNPDRQKLAVPLLGEVVEYYINDLCILKRRYRIDTNRIQLHKIAGLMTGAVLRFRPIIPLVDELESEYELYANELLAVVNGIAICGEYAAKDGQLEIFDEPWFNPGLKDFLFLLHFRHITSEGLIFVYQTLTTLKFPQNFDRNDD